MPGSGPSLPPGAPRDPGAAAHRRLQILSTAGYDAVFGSKANRSDQVTRLLAAGLLVRIPDPVRRPGPPGHYYAVTLARTYSHCCGRVHLSTEATRSPRLLTDRRVSAPRPVTDPCFDSNAVKQGSFSPPKPSRTSPHPAPMCVRDRQ